jgi:hypothetical protein
LLKLKALPAAKPPEDVPHPTPALHTAGRRLQKLFVTSQKRATRKHSCQDITALHGMLLLHTAHTYWHKQV